MKLFYPLKLKIARYPYRKRGTHHGWIIAPVDISMVQSFRHEMIGRSCGHGTKPSEAWIPWGNHQWRSRDSAYDNLLLDSESFPSCAKSVILRQAQRLLAPGFKQDLHPALLGFPVAFMHMNCARSIRSFRSAREGVIVVSSGMSQYVSWKRQSFGKRPCSVQMTSKRLEDFEPFPVESKVTW